MPHCTVWCRPPLMYHGPLEAVDRDVGGAVAVVVAGHRDVGAGAELGVALAVDVPAALGRSVDRDVGGAVAVVVAGHRDVAVLVPHGVCVLPPPLTYQTPWEGRKTAMSVVPSPL